MPTIGPLLARDLGSFAFEVPSDPIARVSARVSCFVFGLGQMPHKPWIRMARCKAALPLVCGGFVMHLKVRTCGLLGQKALAPSHSTVALRMYFYYYRTIYVRSCLYDMLTLTLRYPVPDRPRSANIGSGWPIGSCHRGSPIIALEFSAIQPAFQPPQSPLAPTGLNPWLITSLPAPSKSLRLISPLW